MVRHRKPPSPTWRSFLDLPKAQVTRDRYNVGDLMSMDFLAVPTATFRALFVLVVLALQMAFPTGTAPPRPIDMHVRTCKHVGMRTTIEISDDQRARLLELAARRGQKGYSLLVQEALDRYLQEQTRQDDRVDAALAVLGSFDDEEADRLEASVRDLRGRWR